MEPAVNPKESKQIKGIAPAAIIGIVVAIAASFGGFKYGQSKSTVSAAAGRNFSGASNFAGGRRAPGGSTGFGGAGANAITGEIIASDATSITVKLRDGGSKIIFFSSSTPVTKTAAGTKNDLKIGESILIMGAANEDGSVNAQSIQLRPTFSSSTRR